MLDDGGNKADFIELVNAMSHQPGCEQDENNASCIEEILQIEFLSFYTSWLCIDVSVQLQHIAPSRCSE